MIKCGDKVIDGDFGLEGYVSKVNPDGIEIVLYRPDLMQLDKAKNQFLSRIMNDNS